MSNYHAYTPTHITVYVHLVLPRQKKVYVDLLFVREVRCITEQQLRNPPSIIRTRVSFIRCSMRVPRGRLLAACVHCSEGLLIRFHAVINRPGTYPPPSYERTQHCELPWRTIYTTAGRPVTSSNWFEVVGPVGRKKRFTSKVEASQAGIVCRTQLRVDTYCDFISTSRSLVAWNYFRNSNYLQYKILNQQAINQISLKEV